MTFNKDDKLKRNLKMIIKPTNLHL